jgi:hypothetical protein
MKKTNPEHRNRIILREHPNYSFCRTSKKVYRSNFGSNVEIRKDSSGRFKLKKNSKPHLYSVDELIKLTDYAGRNCLLGRGGGKG